MTEDERGWDPLPTSSPSRRAWDVNGYGGFLYMVLLGLVALVALAAALLWRGALWVRGKILERRD